MKKYRFVTLVAMVALAAFVFAGCGAVKALVHAENQIEQQLDQIENTLETPQKDPVSGDAKTITREEAEAIALKHAKLAAESVVGLHSDYDVDDGIPEWEIEFYNGDWEYEYTVHAETGAILRSEKDVRD